MRSPVVLPFILSLCAAFAFVGTSPGQQTPPAEATPPPPATTGAVMKPFTVTTREIAPFVMKQNGRLTGYSIELWERIVREAKLPFDPAKDYRVVDSVGQMMSALEKKEVDAAVGAISITSEREQVVDFSQPFYESGLQIMTRDQGGSSLKRIVSNLFKGQIFTLIGILIVLILVYAHLLWFVERRKNPESFPMGYFAGVFEALWWSSSTIITGGCENLAPAGLLGRLSALLWMLAGMATFSYVTASISSTLTVDTLNSDIHTVGDLKERKLDVACVRGSTGERFMQGLGFKPQGFDTADAAAEALEKGSVQAVVYDSPILRYYIKNHPDAKVLLAGELFEKQSYGIGTPQGSPQRKEITRAILKLREEGVLEELETKYFGATAAASR